MPGDQFDLYRRRVKAMLDQEVAELEAMRARFSAVGSAPTDAMARVCVFTKERIELLAVRVRLLDHDPELRP
jgi:hypothetical protein